MRVNLAVYLGSLMSIEKKHLEQEEFPLNNLQLERFNGPQIFMLSKLNCSESPDCEYGCMLIAMRYGLEWQINNI